MSANLDRVQTAVAAFNAGDLEAYLELYHPDVRVHGYTPEPLDLAGARAFYGAMWEAFPGSTLESLDVIEAGDRIVVRFVQRGPHRGAFQGVPPTGADIALPGITILRFGEDGRVIERWSQADLLGLLVQIGAIPPPGA